MANIKYCPLCKRNIEPTKKFNWPLFIILLLIGFAPGLIYFIYHLIKPKKVCPFCGTKKLLDIDKVADQAMIQQQN